MNDRRIEIQGGGDGTGFKLSVYFDRLPQMALPKYRKLLHLYFTALSVYPQPDTPPPVAGRGLYGRKMGLR